MSDEVRSRVALVVQHAAVVTGNSRFGASISMCGMEISVPGGQRFVAPHLFQYWFQSGASGPLPEVLTDEGRAVIAALAHGIVAEAGRRCPTCQQWVPRGA